MIRSFRNKGLRRFGEHGDASRLSVQNLSRLNRILGALDQATEPKQMNAPGWAFHALKGDQAGRYAVSAIGNWRVTFAWQDSDAIDVDLEDYH